MGKPIHLTDNAQLVLTGSVSVRAATEFARAACALLQQNCDATIVCTDAVYLDCSIWQQIAMLAAALRAQGKRLHLLGCSPILERDGQLIGVMQFVCSGK